MVRVVGIESVGARGGATPHPAPSNTAITPATTLRRWEETGSTSVTGVPRYFFVDIGLSSIKTGQKPCGFALSVAFLMTVIFAIVISPTTGRPRYGPAR